jgi:hypothetical protein
MMTRARANEVDFDFENTRLPNTGTNSRA